MLDAERTLFIYRGAYITFELKHEMVHGIGSQTFSTTSVWSTHVAFGHAEWHAGLQVYLKKKEKIGKNLCHKLLESANWESGSFS